MAESEEAFRNRLIVPLHEQRDIAIAQLRDSFAKKQDALAKKLQAANEKYQQQAVESSKGWLDAGVSIGSAVLGAFMGRKALSQTNINNVKRAMNSMCDINANKQTVAELDAIRQQLQQELDSIGQQLQSQIDTLATTYDAQSIALDTVQIAPAAKDITVLLVGVLYQPL